MAKSQERKIMTIKDFFETKEIGKETLALKMKECRANFKDCIAAIDTQCVFRMDGAINHLVASIPNIPFPGRDALEDKLYDVLDEKEFDHESVRAILVEMQERLEFAYEVTLSCLATRFSFI